MCMCVLGGTQSMKIGLVDGMGWEVNSIIVL